MTPERIEKERSAFEAWHKETFGYLPKKYKDGTFMSPSRADEVNPQDMFEGWLANAAQSEWISVEERLPEVNGTYLGFNNNAGMVGAVKFYKYHTGKGLFHDHRILNVTHWQPLPEPPETRGK